MADGFGWERSVLGSAVALFLCVSAFCLYVSGYLADRITRHFGTHWCGAEIDYVDDLIGQSFEIRNPNAVASCGCGTSFALA